MKANVTVNCVHPGIVRTRLTRDREGIITDLFFFLASKLLKTIPQAAATMCYVATHPRLRDVSGKYFADCNSVCIQIYTIIHYCRTKCHPRLSRWDLVQAAATMCYVATHPRLRDVSGKYFADCNPVCIQIYTIIHYCRTKCHPRLSRWDSAVLQSVKAQWQNTPPSWKKSDDPCGASWEGVMCNNSRVTALGISTIGLEGKLNGDIGGVTEARSLDLCFNSGLTGRSLSPRSGDLPKLVILMSEFGSIQGAVPQNFKSYSVPHRFSKCKPSNCNFYCSRTGEFSERSPNNKVPPAIVKERSPSASFEGNGFSRRNTTRGSLEGNDAERRGIWVSERCAC